MAFFSTIKGSPDVFWQLQLISITAELGKHFWGGPGGAGDWPKKFEASVNDLSLWKLVAEHLEEEFGLGS